MNNPTKRVKIRETLENAGFYVVWIYYHPEYRNGNYGCFAKFRKDRNSSDIVVYDKSYDKLHEKVKRIIDIYD